MQSVSEAYVESMKQIGRNRGYIKVTLGIINSEAQENIEVADKKQIAYFSDESVLKGETATQIYATCEENFSRVDGSMFFLPPTNKGLYNNGIVSKNILGAIKFTFNNGESYDVAGFTIDFGDCYPVDFTISNGKSTLSFENNDSRYFVSDLGLHEISELTITATKMVNGQGRLRIYSLAMGVSNTFTNSNTTAYEQTTYVSPISDSLPSTDMSITVTNYDGYYNPDNENSVLAFFEVGQEVKVQFGYDVDGDGNIEWLPETVTHLKEWSATDVDATFRSTDIFDYLSGTYYKGKYYEDGINLYDLAVDVFEDANFRNYKLDSYLKKVVVHNPLPIVPHTQALQIIANAGRCTIREDRDGTIYIESSFIPDYTASCNGETSYSNVANIVKDTEKIAYAIQANNFSTVDGSLEYLGNNAQLDKVGYISSSISNANGLFETNPKITLDIEADYAPYGMYICFRNVAPKKFTITTFLGNTQVQSFEVEDSPLIYTLSRSLSDFNRLEVEFTQCEPNSRVAVDKMLFGAPTDYTLKREMMMRSPTAKRQDKIRDIVVSVFNYKSSVDERKDLVTSTLNDVEDGDYSFYFNNPSYGIEASVVEGTASISLIEVGTYSAIVHIENATPEIKIALSGYEYEVDEQLLTIQHAQNGYSQTWSNPLVSDIEHAKELESWLADYFLGDVEYEFEWRGDPRTDANDLFYMELKSGELVNVRGYQNSLSFNGAWSGSMKARKVVL